MKKFFVSIGKFFKKLGYSICKFFVLTYREMKKVRWPDKSKMKEASAIVLSFVLLFGLYIILDDFIIAQLLKLIKY
jgi:preprotein translocase SecE subunit